MPENHLKVRLEQFFRWLGILSLDAPLVALGWETMIHRSLPIDLRWGHYVMLANSVWLVYAGDRLLDGIRIGHRSIASPRRRFAVEHRGRLAVALALAVAVNGLLTLYWLDSRSIQFGLSLLVLVLVYLVLAHAPWLFLNRLPLKELLIAILFAAGLLVFPAARIHPDQLSTLLPWTPMSLLFLSNTVAISCWEVERDRLEGQSSLATHFPGLTGMMAGLIGILAAGFLCLAYLAGQNGAARPLLICSSASLSLLLVHQLRHRMGIDTARTLADLALLVPIPIALILG